MSSISSNSSGSLLENEISYAVRFHLSNGETVALSCQASHTFGAIKNKIWTKKSYQAYDKPQYVFKLLNGQVFFDDNDPFAKFLQLVPIFRESNEGIPSELLTLSLTSGNQGASGNFMIECQLIHKDRLSDRFERDNKTMSSSGILHHHGFLSNKGILSWKSRYYAAQEQTLFVFDSVEHFKERKPALELLALGSCVAEKIDPTQLDRQHPYTFEMKSLKPTGWNKVQLSSESDADMYKWIDTVNILATRRLKSIVVTLGEELEMRGMNVEGLFRVPGNKNDVEATKQSYDNDNFPNLHVIQDDHTLAGLLKLCLRQLPEPIMTYNKYNEFIGTCDVLDREVRLQRLKTSIAGLPPSNQGFLEYLMCFLHRVTLQSDKNLMTPKNLAIVFAPNVLRPLVESVQSIMTDSQLCLQVVELLISSAYDIWPPVKLVERLVRQSICIAATQHVRNVGVNVMGGLVGQKPSLISTAGGKSNFPAPQGITTASSNTTNSGSTAANPANSAGNDQSKSSGHNGYTRSHAASLASGSLCVPDILSLESRTKGLVENLDKSVNQRRSRMLESFTQLINLANSMSNSSDSQELPLPRERELIVKRSLEIIQTDLNKVLKGCDQLADCIEGMIKTLKTPQITKTSSALAAANAGRAVPAPTAKPSLSSNSAAPLVPSRPNNSLIQTNSGTNNAAAAALPVKQASISVNPNAAAAVPANNSGQFPKVFTQNWPPQKTGGSTSTAVPASPSAAANKPALINIPPSSPISSIAAMRNAQGTSKVPSMPAATAATRTDAHPPPPAAAAASAEDDELPPPPPDFTPPALHSETLTNTSTAAPTALFGTALSKFNQPLSAASNAPKTTGMANSSSPRAADENRDDAFKLKQVSINPSSTLFGRASNNENKSILNPNQAKDHNNAMKGLAPSTPLPEAPLHDVEEPSAFALATSLAEAKSSMPTVDEDAFSSAPLKICVVLYPYKGVPEDGELDLGASETIIILDSSSESGWWRGRNQKGQEGFFPSNFVKVLQ
jgi:hypothetical protein